MAARAIFTFVAETNPQFTKGKAYPAYESASGSFRTVDDAGRIASIGEASDAWQLESLGLDGEMVWERPQEKEKDDGKQSNGTEGRDAAKDEAPKGGGSGENKENREGGTDEGQRG